MEYAFARSDNRLLAPDFDPSFKEAGEAGAKLGHFVKQMPWVLTLMKLLPDSVQITLNPVMASYIKLNKVWFPGLTRYPLRINCNGLVNVINRILFGMFLRSTHIVAIPIANITRKRPSSMRFCKVVCPRKKCLPTAFGKTGR